MIEWEGTETLLEPEAEGWIVRLSGVTEPDLDRVERWLHDELLRRRQWGYSVAVGLNTTSGRCYARISRPWSPARRPPRFAYPASSFSMAPIIAACL